jgi:hypothetical protein
MESPQRREGWRVAVRMRRRTQCARPVRRAPGRRLRGRPCRRTKVQSAAANNTAIGNKINGGAEILRGDPSGNADFDVPFEFLGVPGE